MVKTPDLKLTISQLYEQTNVAAEHAGEIFQTQLAILHVKRSYLDN
jgi:hypothetical protein